MIQKPNKEGFAFQETQKPVKTSIKQGIAENYMQYL
jgi:hypothetical protein